MLGQKVVDNLVKVIRKAYSDYPKNDSTVDEMIAQGIRSAYIRGAQDSQKDLRLSILEDEIRSLAHDRRIGNLKWSNLVNRAAHGDHMAKALVRAVMSYDEE